MATKKVGVLVKEARLDAGLTQEQLAKKVTGAEASDISQLERGEVDFTQAQLKQIAKATGVTQTSLIDAPKNLGKSSSSKTTSKKTSSSSSKSSGSKTSSSSKSSGSKSTSSKSTSSKSSSSKSTSTKSTSSKSSGSKSSSGSTAKKSSSSSGTSMKVSATEKKLVELYRDADSDTKKFVTAVLKGEIEPPPMPGSGAPGAERTRAQEQQVSAGTDFLGSVIAGVIGELGKL